MSTRIYDVGDRPEITALFATSAEVPTNPTTVVVVTRSPAGVETITTSPNAAITNPTTGTWVYTFPAPITEAGVWHVRMKATAGLVTAGEISFVVQTSAFAAP